MLAHSSKLFLFKTLFSSKRITNKIVFVLCGISSIHINKLFCYTVSRYMYIVCFSLFFLAHLFFMPFFPDIACLARPVGVRAQLEHSAEIFLVFSDEGSPIPLICRNPPIYHFRRLRFLCIICTHLNIRKKVRPVSDPHIFLDHLSDEQVNSIISLVLSKYFA